jgi:hypothetical protein
MRDDSNWREKLFSLRCPQRGERIARRVIGGGIDAEGSEDGPLGLFGRPPLVTRLVDVGGDDPGERRELLERRTRAHPNGALAAGIDSPKRYSTGTM